MSSGLPVKSAYTASADMAHDTAAMLDVLGIAQAHICGASMGGMVAQQLAGAPPEKVKSLTLMMTSSGARRLPGPSMKVRGALLSRPDDPKSIDSVIAHYVRLYKLIGSPVTRRATPTCSKRLGKSVRRSYRPRGTAAPVSAIAADGDRSALLAQIRCPTRVLHGLADPLVPVAAGRDPGGQDPGRAARSGRRHGPRPADAAVAAFHHSHQCCSGACMSLINVVDGQNPTSATPAFS
jgi:pimeloyl-ACP methyl ester carboxylesterase